MKNAYNGLYDACGGITPSPHNGKVRDLQIPETGNESAASLVEHI